MELKGMEIKKSQRKNYLSTTLNIDGFEVLHGPWLACLK